MEHMMGHIPEIMENMEGMIQRMEKMRTR